MEYVSPIVHKNKTLYCCGSNEPCGAAAQDGRRRNISWSGSGIRTRWTASVTPRPCTMRGLLYCVNNDGILYAFDAKTGALIYKEELAIPSASGKSGGRTANLYASVTLAGNYLLVCNDAGESLVIAPGRNFQAGLAQRSGQGLRGLARGRRQDTLDPRQYETLRFAGRTREMNGRKREPRNTRNTRKGKTER